MSLDRLPFGPPVKPMLAKAVQGIPDRDDLAFEPKWDGFRCIVYRSGDEVHLGSRNTKPLTRYFPELLDPIRDQLPDRIVFDAEIIVAIDDHLEFDSIRKLRSAVGNWMRSSPQANIRTTSLADEKGGYLRLCDHQTTSLWFCRFVSGCSKRMGQIWKPNKAL